MPTMWPAPDRWPGVWALRCGDDTTRLDGVLSQLVLGKVFRQEYQEEVCVDYYDDDEEEDSVNFI